MVRGLSKLLFDYMSLARDACDPQPVAPAIATLFDKLSWLIPMAQLHPRSAVFGFIAACWQQETIHKLLLDETYETRRRFVVNRTLLADIELVVPALFVALTGYQHTVDGVGGVEESKAMAIKLAYVSRSEDKADSRIAAIGQTVNTSTRLKRDGRQDMHRDAEMCPEREKDRTFNRSPYCECFLSPYGLELTRSWDLCTSSMAELKKTVELPEALHDNGASKQLLVGAMALISMTHTECKKGE